jgi:hypothetical protein
MTNGHMISITLSPAQVDHIVRAAARGSTPGFSVLISTTLVARARLAEDRAENPGGRLPAPAPDDPRAGQLARDAKEGRDGNGLASGDPRLSRSLLRGLSILTCFGPGREERGILELAGELGMSPSTTHRYVATLVELGLLERCPRSRKYRLALV